MTIDRKNLAVGLIYLGLGLGALYMASNYRLGSLQRMGPGFFPIMVASGLALIGLVMTAKSLIPGKYAEGNGWDWRPALAVCGATALFGLLLKPAGLFVATAVLIGVASLGNRNRAWKSVAMAILFLSVACWGIFIYLLRLPLTFLPAGMGF